MNQGRIIADLTELSERVASQDDPRATNYLIGLNHVRDQLTVCPPHIVVARLREMGRHFAANISEAMHTIEGAATQGTRVEWDQVYEIPFGAAYTALVFASISLSRLDPREDHLWSVADAVNAQYIPQRNVVSPAQGMINYVNHQLDITDQLFESLGVLRTSFSSWKTWLEADGHETTTQLLDDHLAYLEIGVPTYLALIRATSQEQLDNEMYESALDYFAQSNECVKRQPIWSAIELNGAYEISRLFLYGKTGDEFDQEIEGLRSAAVTLLLESEETFLYGSPLHQSIIHSVATATREFGDHETALRLFEKGNAMSGRPRGIIFGAPVLAAPNSALGQFSRDVQSRRHDAEVIERTEVEDFGDSGNGRDIGLSGLI